MKSIFKSKGRKAIAIAAASVTLLSALAAGMNATFAAKNDIVNTFDDPNPDFSHLETGETAQRNGTNIYTWNNSDSSVLQMTAGTGNPTATVKGLKAGTTVISVATKSGLINTLRYQVTDSKNITRYRLANGGEGIIGKIGGSLSIPSKLRAFVTPAGQTGAYVEDSSAKDTILWSTFRPNDPVATVDENTGVVSGLSKGVTIIVGSFSDKWGRARELHFLVSVGVSINDSDLGKLLDLLGKAEEIMNTHPNPYTTDSLLDLSNAHGEGMAALDGTEQEISEAIRGLEDAFAGLDVKSGAPGHVVGPDAGGNYYEPLDDPANVFKVVDQNGKSTSEPPVYVYDPDGDPTDGNARPAYPNGGFFYVEDPLGSNLYKAVDQDGTLIHDPAIWGGPDGRFGGVDDQRVGQFDDGYYVDLGQNVFQKVETPVTLGPKVGGGTDANPATDPLTHIVNNGSAYYAGPFGNDNYYIGDKPGGGGLNTDGDGAGGHQNIDSSDCKYWRDENGNMFDTPPISKDAPAIAQGRTLSQDKTGDTSDWVEIATNSIYSLIVRKDLARMGSVAGFKFNSIVTAGNNYVGSVIQGNVNAWFTNSGSNGLANDARLRRFTVENNATAKLGVYQSLDAAEGFSAPTSTVNGNADNVAFLLSFQEAASFVSWSWYSGSAPSTTSAAQAIANWQKLNHNNDSNNQNRTWLRTAASDGASQLSFQGEVGSSPVNTSFGMRPALWVKTAVFDPD
jgi:hypothetical protein